MTKLSVKVNERGNANVTIENTDIVTGRGN
jgi:hypothetical protein